MERAVARGMSRRTVGLPEALAVDETSFQKRHEYVTVVPDLDRPENASCTSRTDAARRR